MRALIDTNRQRERRRQIAMMERIENKFVPLLSAAIYNATSETVAIWNSTNQTILPGWFRERIDKIYDEMITTTVVVFGVRVWQQGKNAGVVLEQKQDFAQTMMLEATRYIAREVIRRRITGVEQETRENIVRAIARGYAEGMGQNEIADDIIDMIGEMSRWRARMIARTEVHGAANYGAYEAAKKTGLPMLKEWISTVDKRTRTLDDGDMFGHLEFNGTKVGMDEPFVFTSNDGINDSIMFPGDPNGAASNVINCRCAIGFVVDTDTLL